MVDSSINAFDLALCIAILQTKSPILTTRDYIRLLRCLTSESNKPSNCGSIEHPHQLDGSQMQKKVLVGLLTADITGLKARLLELEAERDELRSRLQLRKRKNTGNGAAPMKRKKENGGETTKGKPNSINIGILGTIVGDTQECRSEMEGELKELSFIANLTPQLLNSMRLLRLSSTAPPISSSIIQICHALTCMTKALCDYAPFNQPPYSVNPITTTETTFNQSAQRIQKAFLTVLRQGWQAIRCGLCKLTDVSITSQEEMGSSATSEYFELATQAVIKLFGDLLSSVYMNGLSLQRAITANLVLTVPWNIDQRPVAEKLQPPSSDRFSFCGIDYRPMITTFAIEVLDSCRVDKKGERQCLEAVTFWLVGAMGSLLVTYTTGVHRLPIPVTQANSIGGKPQTRGNFQESNKQKNQSADEQKQGNRKKMVEELMREETSWFWLEILEFALDRYWKQLKWVAGAHSHESVDRAEDERVSIAEGRMILVAKRKLKEVLLAGVTGLSFPQSPLLVTRSQSVTRHHRADCFTVGSSILPGDMKIINTPALNELWTLIGLEDLVL